MTGRPALPETVPSTDGVILRLHDLGGDGPLLVLCHATGFCGPMWGPAAEVLGRRYRCVALDFRAHGRSTRPSAPMLWSGMAADVIAVVSALSPGQPVAAVGHSMGGAVLVLAELSRPGTISRAWTFEPIFLPRGPGMEGPQPSPISEGARRRRHTFGSAEEAYERYRSRPPLDRLDDRALRLYIEHGFEERPDRSVTLRCRPEDEAGVFEYHHSGVSEVLGRLRIPYLVALGGEDEGPVRGARQAVVANPHLELVEYPELGHFGPLEAPELLAADMLSWLG